MADKKMYILRGVADTDGKDYPDENGDPIKWKDGALHRKAAEDYAGFKGYKPIVLDVSGKADQGTTGKPTEQTKEALKRFLGDPVDDPDKPDTAFYGFSGGGYNIYWILQILAKNEKIPGVPGDYPEALHRIDLVVVFGAPKTGSSSYDYPAYNNLAKKHAKDPTTWKDLHWTLVYRKNPKPSALAKSGVPETVVKKVLEKFDTHMFGPEVLLAEAKDKGAKEDDYWQK
jgi:hypothetical protein